MKSQVVPVVLGGYLAPIQFGYEPLDEKKKLPNYTEEYLKVLKRPMKPGLIEFISTVIIGTMGYGKTELAKWVAVKVSKFYGAENVNAIMNRSADLKILLEAMDDKPVQLLFLDDSFGEMPEDIAKQFTLIRHRFKAVLEEAGKPESGVVIALFGIQDVYTLDKLARRVSTATIAKSSSGDQWYKNSLKQAFGEDGVRELDRITRKVTRNYDQDIKGRSVITITGYEKTGYIENEMVDENLYTEVLSFEAPEKDSEPSSPRVSNEKRFTYDISGDFVDNVQQYIRAKMPKYGEDGALVYPWVIQGKPASHIAAIYPSMGSEKTVQRRVSDLCDFLHSGEAARVIGLEIFEPWFRKTMRDLGHHVTSSESTARGGIDAMVDGVVHSLKCYHQEKRNTITIGLEQISADEREAAQLKGRLVVVLMNPFWGTNPRYKELTLEELKDMGSITLKNTDPEIDVSSAGLQEQLTVSSSQPHTRAEPGDDETQTENTDEGQGSDALHVEQAQATAEAEPQAGQAAEATKAAKHGVETRSECWPDPTLLEPVAYFKAMEGPSGH